MILSMTIFNIKADTCNGYELRVRDNLKKEEVINCYTDYSEAKKAMNDYQTDDKHVSVIYKNNT